MFWIFSQEISIYIFGFVVNGETAQAGGCLSLSLQA